VTISITWDVPQEGIEESAAHSAVEAALAHGGRSGIDLEVVFISDEALSELHERFLDDPSPTDVIAFDLGDGPGPAGEVYVSVDRARIVAAERNVELARELALYLVHGALHLCGFDDHEAEDRAAMRAAELVVLRELGYADDTLPHETL
jgi:probable rRNA maturation factor